MNIRTDKVTPAEWATAKANVSGCTTFNWMREKKSAEKIKTEKRENTFSVRSKRYTHTTQRKMCTFFFLLVLNKHKNIDVDVYLITDINDCIRNLSTLIK